MFNIVSLCVLALATSSVTSLAIPRGAAAPSTWSNSLEDYTTYHNRYLAIGCYTKHDTSFFDRCCRPLQRGTEPNSACASSSSSAALPEPSPVDTEEDDGDCEESDGTEDDDTTTVAAVPKPTPTSTPVPAPSNSPSATSNNVVSAKLGAASNSDVQTGGFATFFYQNGNAGACGTVHKDGDLVAAIDADRYGNTGAKSSLCGKRVEITNTNNHKSVTVTIADACPTCKNRNSIDLSTGAFLRIATEEEGMVPITWKFTS
ncbi:hypothetical protein P691DRAFT_692150 [Macrolepiota fuliginosa MF-IS2]|uniref:RlpA-like protein double-psi beta-barrel domain-containing protein n=1 Tax=Macrolepiota fuliginosa MF-IS2 TaxID=1400762 RepID=A0A9P5XRP4_9AGAR|nr:hypothetical protein P691DRAFT_692150 [Macrolepiota fuliginosa MF-IS2]